MSVTSALIKFFGGVALGAVVGAGVYLVISSEDEEGVVHGVKEAVNRALEEGRRAAELRRRELELELGFPLDSEKVK